VHYIQKEHVVNPDPISVDTMQKLRNEVLWFLKENRVRCQTPKQAFGRCYDLSTDLAEWLADRGVKVKIIRGHKFIGKLGPDAALRWRVTAPEELVHHAVLIEEPGPAYHTVVDLTGSQFGRKYAEPMYALDAWLDRWRIVAVGEPADIIGAEENWDWDYLKGSEVEDVALYDYQGPDKPLRPRRRVHE
jgi:hypothetical protein